MDLGYSPEEQAFQSEVRAFLADALPRDMADRVAMGTGPTHADMERWHAILNDRGWLGGSWHGNMEARPGVRSSSTSSKRKAHWPMRHGSCPSG